MAQVTTRKYMYPIAGRDPGSTATSRCSQSQLHKTGTTVLVLTSHLPSATSKSTDLTDQASFPSTDTVITTKKKLVLTLNEIVNACLWIFYFLGLQRDHDEGRVGRAPFSCWRRSLTALA